MADISARLGANPPATWDLIESELVEYDIARGTQKVEETPILVTDVNLPPPPPPTAKEIAKELKATGLLSTTQQNHQQPYRPWTPSNSSTRPGETWTLAGGS